MLRAYAIAARAGASSCGIGAVAADRDELSPVHAAASSARRMRLFWVADGRGHAMAVDRGRSPARRRFPDFSPDVALRRRGVDPRAVTRPRTRTSAAGTRDDTGAARCGSPRDASALQLRDIRKSFGATPIIRGVTLDMRRGERHAIIGPNGAGKSTLFNLDQRALCSDARARSA